MLEAQSGSSKVVNRVFIKNFSGRRREESNGRSEHSPYEHPA